MIPRWQLVLANVIVGLIGLALAAYGASRHDDLGNVLAILGSGVFALSIVEMIRTRAWRDSADR